MASSKNIYVHNIYPLTHLMLLLCWCL